MALIPELSFATGIELAQEIAAGRSLARSVVESCLQRIDATEQQLGAWVVVRRGGAERDADEFDDGPEAANSRLAGVPIGLKDLIDVAGVPTTASCRARGDAVPFEDSTVWRRLRGAGLILLGKTETHELGSGVTTPQTANPWDLGRSPGGSSGGSGAALAARHTPLSLGTDTGGSVRIPAAACGVTGLRVAFGRVSRAGLVGRAPSMDSVGPMARSVADCAALLQIVAGPDPADPATLALGEPPQYPVTASLDLNGVRLGFPSEQFWDESDPGVVDNAQDALTVLRELGATTVHVEIPGSHQVAMEAFHEILLKECAELYNVDDIHPDAGFGRDFVDQVKQGHSISHRQLFAAQRLRERYTKEWYATVHDHGVDALAFPTTGRTAPPRDTEPFASGTARMWQRNSRLASLTNMCELAFPVGLSDGLPTGLSLAALPLREPLVLRLGLAYQAVTDHHERIPAVVHAGSDTAGLVPEKRRWTEAQPLDAVNEDPVHRVPGVNPLDVRISPGAEAP